MLTLKEIEAQEKEAVLPKFDKNDAWRLGNIAHDLAGENAKKIGISVKLFNQHIFFFAGPDTIQDNEFWINRKRNVVERHNKSSYYISNEYEMNEEEYYRHNAVEAKNFAIHGGGFPIRVDGVGLVGTIVCSGMVSEEDHLLGYHSLIQLKEELSK